MVIQEGLYSSRRVPPGALNETPHFQSTTDQEVRLVDWSARFGLATLLPGGICRRGCCRIS